MKNKLYHSLEKVLILTLFLSLSSTAYSQTKMVQGKVVDAESNQPLPGVNVLEKGTNNGVITDIEGKYSISISSDILIFTYVGYATQEINVGSQSVVDVNLSFDFQSLSEVVITGYSVDSRRETTGSVATIEAKDLKVTPSGNVEQQLQGRVSGVTVITNGQPGTTSQVRVRGYGALGGNAPLYIVDGVPVESTDFLSPDDIETTTVLKDATAASIYGARAAGGVIVYTTRQGEKGKRKMQVSYDGMIGVTTPGKGDPKLNPTEQAEWTWNAIRNAATLNGQTPVFSHPQYGTGSTPIIPDYLLVGGNAGVVGTVDLNAEAQLYNIDPEAGSIYQVIRANKEGTDWYDAITRNASLHRHNFGFTGGGEGSRYYVGLGLQEQEGIVLHQKFSRYTFRVNSEFDLLPNLRIGENIQGTYRSARILFGSDGGSGSSDDENVVLSASRMSPIIPIFDEFGGYAGTTAPGFNNAENPVAELDGLKNNRAFAAEAFGNIYIEVEPIKDLVIRSSFGGRFQNFNAHGFTRRTYENSENNSSFGFSQSSSYSTSWVFTNTLSYKKSFGESTFNLLLGQEALNFGTGRGQSGSGINPFSQTVDFVTLNTVGSQVVNGGHSNGINFSSYFGRLTYDFQDKYLATVVLRRDGSSRFGAENRFGTFPAFSAAWRISSEDFMSGVSFIDDMKIRAGYGIMGNSNNVAPTNQFSLFGTSIGASSYDIGGSNTGASQGFYRTRIGNPRAQWEKAITTNIGIDALLFEGKLDVILDIWKKDTEDLLFQLPVTTQSGSFADAPSVNVGKMTNKGVDLKLVTKGDVQSVGYEITLNGSFLKNEIVELAPGLEDLPNRSSTYRGITPVLNQVGQPLSAFYGFEVVGLFRDQAEVDDAATQDGAAPGRFRFADIDGNGVINLDDRTQLGNPIPDFTGGLTIKLNYKNFELEMYSFASIGNEIYNIGKLFTDFYPLFPGAAISARVKDSWTFENPSAEIPIFENTSNFSTNTQSNSFYVEDGSYFRMQNITLAYKLPQSILSNLGMQELRIFGSVNNVFTITGYDGLDPSVGGAADTNFGIDLGNFPITRSWTLGVNASF
ncbi:TonB-dependent receptor [Fulvivirgaceae bacterium BMA10]|uniref:TonB-dependent receptor n=1 Tax=Splendidivirga corallicola TaxID=3051826 RepID=A0ABT8KN53_9BACT|nr:TonB-dependent receptor [Fulvivirgaceae bacterium BMA10]